MENLEGYIFRDYFEDDVLEEILTLCENNNISTIESLKFNTMYIKFLIMCLLCEKDYVNEDLILSNLEYRIYFLSYLMSINLDYGYKLVVINDSDLYKFYLNPINLEEYEINNDKIFRVLYRNANYIDEEVHPVLLPYCYIILYKSISEFKLDDNYPNKFLSRIFFDKIEDIMEDAGMKNVGPLDNYDYFMQNIKFYAEGTISDENLMEDAKGYLYYKNRSELDEILRIKDPYIFKPTKPSRAINYTNSFNKKYVIAYGNKDNFYLLKLQNIANTMSKHHSYIYKEEDNYIKLDNKQLCNFIKFLNHYFNKEESIIKNLKSIIRESIDDNNLSIMEDETYDVIYYKNMLYDGLAMRGWNEGDKYPLANFQSKFNCYFTDTIYYNLEHPYLYMNDIFIKHPKIDHNTDQYLLSTIYISTAIYYLTTKFKRNILNFKISTMI